MFFAYRSLCNNISMQSGNYQVKHHHFIKYDNDGDQIHCIIFIPFFLYFFNRRGHTYNAIVVKQGNVHMVLCPWIF